MAITWAAKAPGETYTYTWLPPFTDGLASFTLTSPDVTIESSQIADNAVEAVISGGTAGTATVTATATSILGEVANETIYLPIRASTLALSNTAHDICAFALRKIFGTGEEPEAEAATDALERLNDMLAAWMGQGADVGAVLPLALSDTMKVSDAFIVAIKNNLILQLADIYGMDVSPVVVANARAGLQLVKSTNLPDDRGAAEYF